MMRSALIVLAASVVCSSCGASPTHPAAAVVSSAPTGYHGFLLKPAVEAPNFTLHDQNGRPFGPRDVRGKWYVVAFLYTHCPDVCPLIASNLATAQRSIPSLRVLAVSVDPKGDTPRSVHAFIADHHLSSSFRYLTGTRAQLAPVWAGFHVATTGGPKGFVSHSAFELLIDPSGRERVLYDSTLRASELTADLNRIRRSAS